MNYFIYNNNYNDTNFVYKYINIYLKTQFKDYYKIIFFFKVIVLLMIINIWE